MVSIINYLVLFLMLVFQCDSLCLAADFRDAEWGMSQDQVKLLEITEPVYPKKDTLTFKGKVAGEKVDIIYEFNSDRLESGKYYFNEKNINNNVYLRDYEKINKFLDLKYGQPESNKTLWSNDIYKEKKGLHGYALSIGHLSFESTWKNNKTIIIHRLSGLNNIIEHSISYYDILSTKNIPVKIEVQEIKGL